MEGWWEEIIKREGTNLGDIQEDCLPLGTQPKRNGGRDLRSRDKMLPVMTLGHYICCPSDTRSCKTIIKASLPFSGFGLVSVFLTSRAG